MIKTRDLGSMEYAQVLQNMQNFTSKRTADTADELWLVQHPNVFTLGQAGKPEHILTNPHNIPIINSDRGGQVTFHGPGQLICYVLVNLKRRNLNIRTLVNILEQSVINILEQSKISASRESGAPGVYVQGKKIASVGLRISKGCSYHGVSINIDMDLAPFSNIKIGRAHV